MQDKFIRFKLHVSLKSEFYKFNLGHYFIPCQLIEYILYKYIHYGTSFNMGISTYLWIKGTYYKWTAYFHDHEFIL